MLDPERLERRATELLQALIRFNTVNPPGNEEAAQEFLRAALERAGFACELLAAVPGRPNLVARLAGPGDDGARLAFLGHVDTVLAASDDWSLDPWSGELRDGCVWGRGALDMKGQVACEVAAACALAEAGWRPESGELLVIVTADEEAGATYGAKWLCETLPERVRCDYVVNEGGGDSFSARGRRVYMVGVAEKGVFRFTVTARGRAGHASIPRIGDNALTKLAPVLAALAGGRPSLEPSPEPLAFMRALEVNPDGDLERALADVEAVDERLGVLVEPTLGVTFAPTMVAASDKVNVIPARARLRVDCRVPPGLGADHALDRIHALLADAGAPLDDLEISFDEQVVGNRSPMEHQLMRHIEGFLDREDPGARVAPSVLPGFTDSRWFREAFPNSVAYGFCPRREMDLFEASPLIHGVDERIPIDDLGLGARFFATLAQELLR